MNAPFVALSSDELSTPGAAKLPANIHAILFQLADSATPPTELRLFAKGVTETTKGPFIFDAQAEKDVMARYSELGKDKLPFDYNHGMLSFIISPDSGKAAAWFIPEVRNGELWATSIEWTKAAYEALSNKEYRFFSPAFYSHYESKRLTELINVALTNTPATKNQKPIVASDIEQEEPMAKTPEELAAEAQRAVVESQNVALLSAAGYSNVTEALADVAASKKRAEDLSKTVRASAIEALSVAGRLPPAQHEFAATLSDDQFAAFVKGLPASSAPSTAAPALALSAPPSGSRAAHGAAPVSAASLALTEEEIELGRQFGQDLGQLASVKAELLTGIHPFRYEPKQPVPAPVK